MKAMPVARGLLQSPSVFTRTLSLFSSHALQRCRGSASQCSLSTLAAPAGGVLHRVHQVVRGTVASCAVAPAAETVGPFGLTAAAARFSTEQAGSSGQRAWAKHADDPPTYVKAAGRIVSIGDLHGDLDKTLRALIAARVLAVDKEQQALWIGGNTVVVQLGDVLDRGDNEIRIILLLRELGRQAREHGGAVYMLNGNHESLNICGNFRYVTIPALLECAAYAGVVLDAPFEKLDRKRQVQHLAAIRHALFRPGGPMALELAKNPTVLVVNDTAFVHGGLLPTHVAYGIERLNSEVAAWIRCDKAPNGGFAPPPFLAMGDAKSVMWTRDQSREVFVPNERFHACKALRQALDKIGAKRLVVGHTPQLGGCNSECDGDVWRIDVGMSAGVLGKPVQILEVMKDADGETSVEILGDDGEPLRGCSVEFDDDDSPTPPGMNVFPLSM